MVKEPTIVILGAGAVGGTVGGWIAPHYERLYFLDQGETAEALKSKGLTLYLQNHREEAATVPVKVVDSLKDVKPDVIVVAVKNYSLDAVARSIRAELGDAPIIVALQNGVENQEILPRHFSKVIYGIVGYNAWIDAPGVIGYQKHGPLLLGTRDNELQKETQTIAEIFQRGVKTGTTDDLASAAHTKMIINLTNSLTTLIGHQFQKISEPKIFQKLLTNLTYEGVRIAKAAGYREIHIGDMPSWKLMWAAAKLPAFLTRRKFEKNVKKMVISSMAQDILQRKGTESELESLNGHFIRLADQYGLDVPYNRVVYELCKQEFNKPDFKPLDVKEVWKKVAERMNSRAL